jgi:uncharacterized protein YjgD (DUF1641 family)
MKENLAMSNEAMILERLDQLDRQVRPLADFAKTAGELRQELAPRVNEAVQALITELADVEADFQIENLLFLIKKAMRNVKNFSFLLDQLENLIDFALTAEPLLKITVPKLISYVDHLEQNGVFRLMTVGTEVFQKIGNTYSLEDMRRIGDGLVQLIGCLKKLTEPAVLDLINRAVDLPNRLDMDRAHPVGVFGLLGAMGDDKVRQGLGVLLEFTRGMATLRAQQ